MAAQLFNLRGVPDDEADAIRALLQDHAIDFYETPAGNWGISMPSIWINDESQLEQARVLIEQYQQQLINRDDAPPRSLAAMIGEHPLRYLAYLALVVLLLYISISPFLKIGRL